MKRMLIPALLLLVVASGCSRNYIIKLTNGGQITTASKPHFKNGSYHYKDARGQVRSMPAGRVTEIEPASMAKEEKSPFTPETR